MREVAFDITPNSGLSFELGAGSSISTSFDDVSVEFNSDHNLLSNRDMVDQHPMSAVTGLEDALLRKQATLVSGENIKTINGESLLGSGNIETLNTAVNGSGELVFWYGATV